jgi:hypothetical protein
MLSNKKTQIFILILLTVLAYIPSFTGVWQYDDIPAVVNNEWIRNGIFNPAFFRGGNFFRATSYMTFALNHSISGYEVFGFHLVNLIIHLLAGIVLYFFIIELFDTVRLKSGEVKCVDKAKLTAFLAALFWLAAPVNVQAVTYIVQRMTSLAGLFYFCSLYFYLKLRNHRVQNNDTNKFFLAGLVISVILAIMSKQNTLLLIPSLLYIEWSFYKDAGLKKVKLYGLIAFFSLTMIILLTYLFFSSGTDSNILALFRNDYPHREFTPLQRLFIQPKILLHYISLMVFPFVGRFHLLYSFDWLNAPYQLMPYFSILFIAIVFFFSVTPKYIRKYRIITFGIFFFLINHLIESSFIGIQLAAEHRNYVPSAGIFLILAIGLISVSEKLRNAKLVYMFAGIFIVFSMLNTWVLNLKYQEEHCNALYDYSKQYNGLDHDVASRAVDRLMFDKDFVTAYKIMAIEYDAIRTIPERNKFFENYLSSSTRFLKFYVFLHYISTGFNIENTLLFIEYRFIRDTEKFWENMESKKNYDNIFHYSYIKSLLRKYGVIDEVTYQKSLQYDPDIIDIYFYFRPKNYEEFVKYNKADIEKLEGVELAENEKSVLEMIK